jgi:hypothetical protein
MSAGFHWQLVFRSVEQKRPSHLDGGRALQIVGYIEGVYRQGAPIVSGVIQAD